MSRILLWLKTSKFWPFAAMDYSIMLLSGPDVNGIQPLIKGEPWADGCGTEPGSMVTFFRSRNALERIAPMRDDYDLVTIRYKYHGFICVEILDIPKIRDPLEVCYDPNEADGNLTIKHFLEPRTLKIWEASAAPFVSKRRFSSCISIKTPASLYFPSASKRYQTRKLRRAAPC